MAKKKAKKVRRKKPKKEGFLGAYEIGDAFMLAPDAASGSAGIISASDDHGNELLVKVWQRKKGSRDEELKEIWRHELRQLHRLAGYPTVSDTIARLHHSGIDEHGFYLVLDPGQRRPLQVLLDHAPRGHWLKVPRLPINRARLWLNLARIAQGMDTLHAQGLLHRNLDEWAVLSAGSDQPDFQLTGFEWSMRLATAKGIRPNRKSESSDHYSFQHDWLMFGLLCGRLLSVDTNKLLDLKIAPSEIAEHLSALEAKLLRAVVHNEGGGRLSGDLVVNRIHEVVAALNADIAALDPKLHLALRLGAGSTLAQRIREASENEIEVDDVEAQLEFIRNDLSDSPLAIAVKPWQSSTADWRMILRGQKLRYQLQQFVQNRTSSVPSWDFAYCDSTEANDPAPVNILGQLPLSSTAIECMSNRDALERFPRLRGKLNSWENVRLRLRDAAESISREELLHRSLTLTQFLETLFAASEVYPVEIISSETSLKTEEGEDVLKLKFRVDEEREELSKALKLKAPAVRFEQALVGDGVRQEGWILTGSKTLGERSPSDTDWRFQSVERSVGDAPVFVFTGPTYVPIISEAFLIPSGSIGRDVQFRRRVRALRALKDHQELLQMLADPRGRILESHDELARDSQFKRLDAAKQVALEQLTSVLPLYLVQGPPGVGKTRLVRDLVQRRISEEPTIRLLLTAQSNPALDHVLSELADYLSKDINGYIPLVVRCRSKDSVEAPSEFEIGIQLTRIIDELVKSSLAKSAPPFLQQRVSQLASALRVRNEATGQPKTSMQGVALRALESLIARAANVVFATTNSAELERLIEDKGQFDWSIVEEAGKATGGELVSPMLLSHRRLMIGDHKQLPPFNAQQMKEILKDPETVKSALISGEDFIGRALRDQTTEEILDDIDEDGEGFPNLCAEALRVLTLFESLIENEFDRQKRGGKGLSIASQLNAQHRMDPLIAELVSSCFYNGSLKTDSTKIDEFKNKTAPFRSADPKRLPNKPIVLVDMPYIQTTIGLKEGDCHPRWHNPSEVRAVIEILDLLRIEENETPSVAVLSPYNQQVSRLNDAIDSARETRLQELSKFSTSDKFGGICSTVDSFQGDEADCVVVSLVRNNQHGSVRSALGFLTDFRRMNVLLSRAKWQLILVGSFDFLDAVVATAVGEDKAEVEFLQKMLGLFKSWEEKGLIGRVNIETLSGVKA